MNLKRSGDASPESQSPAPDAASMAVAAVVEELIGSLKQQKLYRELAKHLPSPQTPPTSYEFNRQPSGSSNKRLLPFDEAAGEQQVRVLDQKKLRRMLSNCESARRSRVRKRMHLDELMWQLTDAQTENHDLIYKLKHVTDFHDLILEDNAKLKRRFWRSGSWSPVCKFTDPALSWKILVKIVRMQNLRVHRKLM